MENDVSMKPLIWKWYTEMIYIWYILNDIYENYIFSVLLPKAALFLSLFLGHIGMEMNKPRKSNKTW